MNGLWFRHPWRSLKFQFWAWASSLLLVLDDLPEIGFDEDE